VALKLSVLGPDKNGRWLLVEPGQDAFAQGVDTPPPMISGDFDSIPCHDAEIRLGWVNAHTHIYSGLAPFGMPKPDPAPTTFIEILERVWWRLDRALGEEALRASARLYVAEALLNGTTALIDHHESPNFIEGSLDVLAAACNELGLRAALCFGATERNGGTAEANRGLNECRRFVKEGEGPLVRGLVALHASFTVSDETIRQAANACQSLGRPMHVHLAEDGADVVDAKERGYDGPLERLADLGALPRGSILAHGVHLDQAQVERTEKMGCWLVQNPRSNRGNEVGYPKHLAASQHVALGTDGYPSDLPAEIIALDSEAGQHGDDKTAVSKRAAAGRDLIGELFGITLDIERPGGRPDVVVVGGEGVRHVLVDGHVRVRDGRLVDHDIERIRSDAAEAADRLWERMRDG
jgi:cytosine/adenosine deaminase-related metal-dependent hydrolase